MSVRVTLIIEASSGGSMAIRIESSAQYGGENPRFFASNGFKATQKAYAQARAAMPEHWKELSD